MIIRSVSLSLVSPFLFILHLLVHVTSCIDMFAFSVGGQRLLLVDSGEWGVRQRLRLNMDVDDVMHHLAEEEFARHIRGFQQG